MKSKFAPTLLAYPPFQGGRVGLGAIGCEMSQTPEKKRADGRAWREANREHIREYMKLYRAENKERIKELSVKHYHANKDANKGKRKKYSAEYRKKNKEAIKKTKAKRQAANKKRLNEISRNYRATNRGATAKRSSDWYFKNSARVKARVMVWYRSNRDKVRTYSRRRRARERGAPGDHNNTDIETVLSILGTSCLACGAASNIAIDHVIPLAKRGGNGPLNLQPLCVSCNSSKHTKRTDYRTPAQIKKLQAAFQLTLDI